MVKAIVILLVLSAFAQNASSQFIENFSDGEFRNSPVWNGDTSYFFVNAAFELQSRGPSVSSEIYLSTEYQLSQNSIWEFYVKLDFASSSSNFARFYLSSDREDLNSDLNGYYVKLGGESGSNDGIDLYVQNGSSHSKIIDGTAGFFGLDTNIAKIKVERTYEGNWSLWADTSLNNSFVLQGEIIDLSIPLDNNLGVFCKHSATRRDKFYFDSISVKDGLFEPIHCIAINDSTLELQFSNPQDSISSYTRLNYFINKGISYPDFVYEVDSIPQRKYLALAEKLEDGSYTLMLSDIFDRQGQSLISDSISFDYYPQPLASELIINEIMVDPNPVVGLPDKEYVEILSIANHRINLKGTRYSDSNTEISFPELLLDSGQYLILCDIEDTAEFKSFGKVLGLESWPSLNNSGDVLTLSYEGTLILDQIEYDNYWTAGNSKDEGGWAYERINPFKKCTGPENWTFSINSSGGSPGRINSVFNPTLDTTGPDLIGIEVFSPTYIKLEFDEILSQDQSNAYNFHFEPENSFQAILISDNTIELSLSSDLDSGAINILFLDSVFDCEGNSSMNISTAFGLGKSPDIFDLIISEIMYDPEPQNALPATEYLELYNNSQEIINLYNTFFISENDTAQLPPLNINPDNYLILCPSSRLEEMYEIAPAISLSPWTSLKNDLDEILISFDSKIIHNVNYSSDWIRDLDKREGGWSLEIIDPKNPCGEELNWGASIDPRGGSPGITNSLFSNNPDLTGPKISSVEILNNSTLRVFFNERLDFLNLHLSNLNIDPGNSVIDFHFENRFSKTMDLFLSEPLENDVNYNIQLNQLSDCKQNYRDEFFQFILPESPEKEDIIINEVLFNSGQDISEYIEFYNRSPKNISLSKSILKYYGIDGQLKSSTVLTDENIIINAFEILVVCEDSSSIIENYPKHGHHYLQKSSIPSLNNDSGILVFLDSNNIVIDSFIYSKDFHFELINDEKGVSLERISADIPTLQEDNWTSASETYGFGSPGIVNSKSVEQNMGEENVIIQPRLFSPDNDGYKDLMHVKFNTQEDNAVASIQIFDLKGRLVKTLANNSSLAYQNDFIWDGINDSGEKALIGNYIVLIDLFDLDGQRNRIKKIIAIGGRI